MSVQCAFAAILSPRFTRPWPMLASFLALFLNLLFGCTLAAEGPLHIDRVDPPNWWIGMQHSPIQLMLYGQSLDGCTASFDDPRVTVEKIHVLENDRYAFVDVAIADDLPAANYKLTVTNSDGSTAIVSFPILERPKTKHARHQGFGPQDVVYLITPDRFANGDPTNDRVVGILDEFDPASDGMRHGGDLRGIIEHLDYLQQLGITAIWLNPVVENNGANSYHGYKATDLYRIDPRFGSNAEYTELVEAAHQRGIKIIFDHVANHIGLRHPWIKNLPTKDWLNGSVDDHLSDKHYLLSVTDPHADPESEKQLKSFWFVDKMPDLNQRNPYLAKYLIQNSIWWIEMSGIDGIREDTYPYADQQFMSDWAKAIRTEYPQFNIVGEIWATKSAYIAHFQDKTVLPREFETNLPAVMDFPLMQAYRDFLSGKGKLRDIHAVYAQDFLFTDTDNLLVFLDNHDTPRALFEADQNVDRVKLALTSMMLGRGIPQILYGTEINMLGGASHIQLRADFPGGFPNSKRNAFSRAGRNAQENDMFDYVQKLIRLRKEHPAITRGKMIHYAPTWKADVYKFIRVADDDRIVVLANGHTESRQVDLSEMHHQFAGGKLRDVMSGAQENGRQVTVDGLTARVFEVVH